MDNNVISFEDEKKKYLLRDKVLVESSFSITATENKILYCILQNAQVRRSEEVHCTMNASDFYKVVSKNEHKTPKYIKECLRKLMRVEYRFWNDEIEGSYNLISGYTRNKETQVFEISIPQEIHKRLMKQKVYSPLDLKVITSLKSFYSQRLYELLRLWSRNDEEVTAIFTVGYVRFILGAEDVCKEFKHLNQYIKKSIKEIESKTKMKIGYETEKEGRKVVKLKFKITDQDERKFTTKTNNEKVNGKTKKQQKGKDGFERNEMTDDVREMFESDFARYDLENYWVKEIYNQCCEAILGNLGADKIDVEHYPCFKERFESRLMPLETRSIGLKTGSM